jgi:hypothetical protein
MSAVGSLRRLMGIGLAIICLVGGVASTAKPTPFIRFPHLRSRTHQSHHIRNQPHLKALGFPGAFFDSSGLAGTPDDQLLGEGFIRMIMSRRRSARC